LNRESKGDLMTRSRALALTLAALFAAGALASSAVASPALETNLSNVTLKGEQAAGTTDVFVIDGITVECINTTFNAVGTTANGSTNAALHPEYGNCTMASFPTNITTTNCNYRGMANGLQNEMTYSGGEIQVECTVNFAITINMGSGACVATIGSQTIGNSINAGIKFRNTTASENIGGLMDFDTVAYNAPVAVTKNADNFLCPFSGTGATTGNYYGTTTVRCFTPPNGVQVDCTMNG
jgi:hypothetical protein